MCLPELLGLWLSTPPKASALSNGLTESLLIKHVREHKCGVTNQAKVYREGVAMESLATAINFCARSYLEKIADPRAMKAALLYRDFKEGRSLSSAELATRGEE
jgi:hypothetical protein